MEVENIAPDGPVTEAVVSEPVATEPSLDDELDAIWDKANAPEGDETDKEEPPADDTADPEADEAPDDEPAVEEPAVEVPDGLPAALRDQWKDIPQAARDAITADRDQLHRKLSDMGRQVQGIGPIRDVLVQAVEKLPVLADMRPQEVAQQVFQLAELSSRFKTQPVETMLGLIQQHGMGQAVMQALSGQGVTQDAAHVVNLQNHIAQLESKIQRLSDPSYLQEQVTAITSQDRAMNDVTEFAAQAAAWADVEEHIPAFIPIVRQKLGQGAAPRAVLEAAYKMAIDTFKPDAKAPEPAPAEEAVAEPDPERAERAAKAKSVNLRGKATGKFREMTEDEALDAAWERAQRM